MFIAFFRDESGSATVEWVVMTAASVGLGLAVINVVSNGVEAASTRIADTLSSMPLYTSFEEWDAFRAARAEDGEETPDT